MDSPGSPIGVPSCLNSDITRIYKQKPISPLLLLLLVVLLLLLLLLLLPCLPLSLLLHSRVSSLVFQCLMLSFICLFLAVVW